MLLVLQIVLVIGKMIHGGGWCEQLNCWSYWDQTGCINANVPGKNCSWSGGGTSSYCTEVSCYAFDETNASACVNNTKGLNCEWGNICFSHGGPSDNTCPSINTKADCVNTTGCMWGNCRDKGCGSYNTNVTCNAAKDWTGNNCTWDNGGSYCKEDRCWQYANSTSCAATSINCEWRWDSCNEINCWSWDGTNQTACVNNTLNISCSWDGKWCMDDGCWNNDQSSCEQTDDCVWDTWTSGGWCEEVQCWSWDSWSGGNQSDCVSNAYGLSCTWSGDPAGNLTNGWCFQNIGALNCANFTTERECMDTFYCWWRYTDWNDVSQGGTCDDPGNWNLNTNDTISVEWNPGCYIFDTNISNCGLIVGCDNSTVGSCDVNSGNANANEINTNGINCTMINESTLCNNIPALSSCCTWNNASGNNSCSVNKLTTSCWDQMSTPPADSCENANNAEDESTRNSNCNQIAGDPWYMPCKWDNNTKMCEFKSNDVFGNGTKSIIKIENKRNCEAAGGKWVIENYCEGNVSVPTGRCEYKFDEEDNCNKACFGCEKKDSNGNSVNATNARVSCTDSTLGNCEYTADTNAPNGIGYCKAKDQFKTGVAGDCDADCGDCTYKGNPNSNDTTKRPNYFCAQSNANSAEGGCKWVTDNSTIGGYCVNKGEKICEDACDRCYSQDDCSNVGRTSISNQSGSCKWQGTSDDGNCVPNIGEDVEICWNGDDDNSDGLIDCADPACYADSFCGFVEGDCFIWTTNTTCLNNDCEWVVDKWGSWCDFKGASCWKNDKNETDCNGVRVVVNESLNITNARIGGTNNINESKSFSLSNIGTGWVINSFTIMNETGHIYTAGNYTIDYSNQIVNFSNTTFMVQTVISNITYVSYSYYTTNCQWSNGSGSGWCERDWSIAEVCMGINNSDCLSNANCTWTNDTWCDQYGNGTDWCNNYGGWCDHQDFAPGNCWMYQTSSTECDAQSRCSWHIDEWMQPHCEVNWSNNCWQHNTENNCKTNNCYWRTETWGSTTSSWCQNNMSGCWGQNTQTNCENFAVAECTWRNNSWGASCEPACFNSTLNDNSTFCNAVSGCYYVQEMGWCEETQMAACSNTTTWNSSTNCDATSGCEWRTPGWCDPKGGGFSGGAIAGGGGVGGSFGADCYKYDGNESYCTNKTLINISCGWMPELSPRCDVDWSNNCWQHSNSSNCNGDSNCWWNSDSYASGGWCGNIMDQCWNNMTLQGDESACNNNSYCNYTSWNSCEPECFSSLFQSQGTCGTGCKWVTGWCNPGDMNDMFNGMESGAPVSLGHDTCDASETNQSSVDICGFGMKDMGDAYGFGVWTYDFSNASICNKEKLSSFVMDMTGGNWVGMGGPTTSERVGSGNDTIKYFVYLDSDGSTTGSCALSHNSSALGYEFRFKYTSVWNYTKAKAVETFNAYKCDNGNWKATDVKLSTWKKKMCSEIGGPMIAVEKDDLSKFSDLYDSTEDIRVVVATAGADNNLTVPSDVADPGWATPGSIDFSIDNAFAYGADSAQFEDILKKGFVSYEDCYNGIDDDSDGNVDCDDWDCEFSDKCTSTGVNAAGFVDNSAPKVTGVKIEEYHNSVLIMYDTNKPTNGSLQFYWNDSTCISQNTTINDVGILKNATIRSYKLWHSAPIYNDSAESLAYALNNNTQYFYKLKVCDSNGKCAVSKCSNFTTAQSSDKCGYCNFVTRIKVPTGWQVSYDVNQNGSYDHIQGQVCGPNAGMKTNYSDGRKVNIKLAKTDGSVYMEFLNATLTKSGLNDKVRTISGSGDLIHDTSEDYVGMDADTRDKIINNLHPEVCKIKIPFSGTCNKIYHCDDSGDECEDRTSDSTLLNAATCVWQLPYCEFSTWDEDGNPAGGGDSSSGSGGGSGGGGGILNTTKEIDDDSVVEVDDEGDVAGTGNVVEENPSGVMDTDEKETSLIWLWILIGVFVVGGLIYYWFVLRNRI